jgi:hypothetical protein
MNNTIASLTEYILDDTCLNKYIMILLTVLLIISELLGISKCEANGFLHILKILIRKSNINV